jgi:hypothetical protein
MPPFGLQNVHLFTIAPFFSLIKRPLVWEPFFPNFACISHIGLIS